MSSSEEAAPFTIIDAHHHLWDLDAVHYPWLAAKGVKRFFGDPTPIQKNYLPDDMRADIGELPVEKTVHIQVGAASDQHLAETAWLQGMADTHKLPNAIVAYCELENANRGKTLDQLQNFAAVRGIRQIVGRSPNENRQTGSGALLNNEQWLEGLKELVRRGLSFDLQLIPDQMEQAYTVLSQVEKLPVALCHCGSPWYRDTDGWQLWQSGLRRLASLPNVQCKISGLGMFDSNWTLDSLKPVFDTVLEIFGPERCMFGSNFPVDKLYRDYQTLWKSYIQLCKALTDTERRQMFSDNCQRFYRL